MSIEQLRAKYEALAPFLDEHQKRLWAAVEAVAIGRGGVSEVAWATGIARGTIQAGVAELQATRDGHEPKRPDPAADPAPRATPERRRPAVWQPNRIRRPGGGRKLTEVKDPSILATLQRLVENDVAGDPMGEAKWVRTTLGRLSEQLKQRGHRASPGTVRRLLVKMGFAMRANKRRQIRSKSPKRDEQFRYIAAQKERFLAAGLPVISVDTKKKELVGNFRNGGRAWCKEADEVDEHDFPGTAECRAVPFGVYDLARNRGYLVVGVSNDTAEFAVTAIAGWWRDEGRRDYPEAAELLILADGGGSNSCRCGAWKLKLQELLCDPFGLTVTVCHYPTGCSKWNPVEHRLFSQVSRNWAGKPLRTLAVMLAYIRGTTTATGLTVSARLDEGVYRKGQKATRQELDRLRLKPHEVCPAWNYTLSPG
jgi:hypothetical protein